MLSFIATCIISLSLLGNFSICQTVDIQTDIPILMYHEIGQPEGPWENLYVSEDDFKKQMEYLKNNNYVSITMEDLEKNRQGKRILPNKPIIITFDDGYSSMYDFVFPILKENNIKGVFYLYPYKFGTWNSLKEEQVKIMADNNMEIGSHSMSHADMTTINSHQLKFELEESKKVLETITGKKIETFCYPAGRYSTSVIEELINHGYKSAVTTKYGFYSSVESLYEIKRIRINYSDSLDSFARKIKN